MLFVPKVYARTSLRTSSPVIGQITGWGLWDVHSGLPPLSTSVADVSGGGSLTGTGKRGEPRLAYLTAGGVGPPKTR